MANGFLTAQPYNNPYTSLSSSMLGLNPGFGFSELAQYEEARRKQLAEDFQTKLAKRRAELAAALTTQGKQLFDVANPGILEDLNARGVFSSPTAIAKAQADALKEIELSNQGFLNEFDTAATATGLQGEQDALDAALDIRRSELENKIQEGQSSREESLARDLAAQQRRGSITESLIGTGGNLLGLSLLTRGSKVPSATGGGLFSGFGGGGSVSNLFGGGATPAGKAISGISGTGTGGVPLSTAGTNPLLGGGNLLGGAGAGFLGTALGRRAFGGGNDVGGIAGSGLGYALGGPVGAGVGGFLGTGAQRLGETAYEKAQKSVGNTLASTIKPIVNPVGAVKSIGKKVKKVFCFDGATPITMEDGTVKPIFDMNLGDKTKGGTVESIRISNVLDGSLYEYFGTRVTGYHAVRENGKWIRVRDSSYATPLNGDGVVYSLATDKHRVFVYGVEFADELETDNYENLTLDESLKELNKQSVLEVA